MNKNIFIKDTPQTKALIKAGRISGSRAYSGSKALGLSITYIENGVVYEEDAQGQVVVKDHIEVITEAPFEIKEGLVLHAK